ncbi:MAG: hypothetical protein PHF33_05150 [Candidatus Delongbacteria bacterium]|nr:hypothetical protein [Candidatus Delongbacteria bacterium]
MYRIKKEAASITLLVLFTFSFSQVDVLNFTESKISIENFLSSSGYSEGEIYNLTNELTHEEASLISTEILKQKVGGDEDSDLKAQDTVFTLIVIGLIILAAKYSGKD